MTAYEIVSFQTGLTDAATVKNLIKMAEMRIREYLGYDETDDLSGLTASIADIATTLYWKAELTQGGIASAQAGEQPVKSESFSEGGVSVSKTYEGLMDQAQVFENLIANKLAEIKVKQKGRIRFL